MRTITLEEHYATEAFMEGPGRELMAQAEAARDHPQVAAGYEKLIEQLCDLGDGSLGLARGDRNPRPTAHRRRGVRQLPEPPTRGRAHG